MANPTPALKIAMQEAFKAAPLSKEQLAEDINKLAHLAGMRARASKAMLEKWLAPGAEGYVIPLSLLPLFCQAVGSNYPLEVYGKAFPGSRVVKEEDWDLLQWARTERAARQARRQARRLAPKVGME